MTLGQKMEKDQKPKIKIDQRYEIVKNLGGGLSGEVMLVRDEDGLKALKFLKKIQMNVSREEALKNFKNEFSILKELNHPNINRILDFGFDTRIQKYFFTNDFIPGKELHEACENQSIEVIEKIIVQVLRALNYLHSRGIYHFDIKPQNILVKMENDKPVQARIIDFGLAGFTAPKKKVGTPAYMAPEVIQGGLLDGRTDLYSFGVLLYRVLTGENPFAAKSLKETLKNQEELVAPPPSQINPDVPKYWDHIVKRLLEKDPAKRYSQASLVIRDLNFLSGKKFEVETKDTKISYLPEKGTLIGRETEWQSFQKLFEETFLSDNTDILNKKILIIEGKKGTGKTRLLSEIKYYSQLRNIPVISLASYKPDDERDHFILTIDNNKIDDAKVNALVQKLSTKKCLIIWATEKAPVNWANSVVITLSNYSETELKQYLESVTGLTQAPIDFIREVYKRTSGNPLFVTEFIKSLLEQGLLFDQSGKWTAKTFQDVKIDFDKIHIPNSVEDYLSERFEKLPHEQTQILKWLAVNNSALPLPILEKLTSSKQIEKPLLKLLSEDILENTSQKNSYYFKNLLFVDVVYKKIPQEQRSQYHDKLAELFANKQDINFLYHTGHGSDQTKAQDALLQLSDIYLEKSEYDKATQCLEKLLSLTTNKDTKLRIKTYFQLAKSCHGKKDYETATQHYETLKDMLAEQNDNETKENLLNVYKKLIELSVVSVKKIDLDRAKEYIAEAQKIIPQTKNQKTHALIFRNCEALLLSKQNQIDEAQAIYEETHKEWNETLTNEEKLSIDNNRLVEIYLLKKENDKAIKTCQQNIAVLKGSKNDYLLSMNYYALGYVYYLYITTEKRPDKKQLIQKCIQNFKDCEIIARKINDYSMMLRAFNGLGNLYTHEQQNEKALDYYNRALAVSRQTDELFTSGLISYNIGRIHMNADRSDEGYSYIIYAINTLENLREQYSPYAEQNLFFAYNSLAEIHLERKEHDKAHEALDKSDELFEQVSLLESFEYWKLIRRAQIFFSEGKAKQGFPLFEKAKTIATSQEEKDDLKKVTEELEPILARTTEHQNDTKNSEKEIKPEIKQKTEGYKIMTSSSQNHKNDDLKKIIEINKLLNSEYDTQQLIKIVLNYALQLSNAEAGYFLSLDDKGELHVQDAINSDKKDKISMSIAKLAVEKGEIITSSDALSDDRFGTSDSIVLNELKSVLCLPVRSKNKCIGVFYLDNQYRVNAFEKCNVDLLNAFCDQVGIALENNKLFLKLKNAQHALQNELDKTNDELTKVKNILKEESEIYKTKYAYKHIVAQSEPMQEVFKVLDKITETNLSVFIHGESGTGKELVAKALHYNNPQRASASFVAINCGAIPANLMESELFGYKAGSFTGATKDKKGLFEEAHNGTLFLDEIGELPISLQVKLLRVLQEGEVQRIGDSKTIKVNVRMICASHKDVEDLAKKGQFREDLYYRLCQMKINLPALRERVEDIPLLTKHFVKKYQKQAGQEQEIFVPPHFMKALLEYNWPGNIRELENLISVSCALKDGNQLSLENIPPNYGMAQMIQKSDKSLSANLAHINSSQIMTVSVDEHNFFDPQKTWKDYEAVITAKCYEQNDKKKLPTAEALQQSHSTIYKKINEFDLDDASNPLYADDFVYTPGHSIKDYVVKVFAAALKYHEDHPYAAIRQLGVSQGYFYKIMKKFKSEKKEENVQA